jgi:hypothetical protein
MWLAGALSDRIGRKKVILTGCLLAAVTFVPVFRGITHYANPDLEAAAATNPVTVRAAHGACGLQIDLLGMHASGSAYDKIKDTLARLGVPYSNLTDSSAAQSSVSIGAARLAGFDPAALRAALRQAGYREHGDTTRINGPSC